MPPLDPPPGTRRPLRRLPEPSRLSHRQRPGGPHSHELDVVTFGLDDNGSSPVLAIGEVKWGETMGIGHIERLAHIRGLLTAQGRPGAAEARLACYSAAGFTDELRERAEADPELVLIEAADLYR
ncbi:hypothetical protein [Streptomyces sp. HPF1205]|uniref:hypothetical protein n=1 Tax=Streptomyces sp. HPF1205 TaxID=2873262 RepID=UPI0027E1FC47|nr:hypothetical protein [Streptomyces sp. HPF1205]